MTKHNLRCPVFSPFPLWLTPPRLCSCCFLCDPRSIRTCRPAHLLQHCRKSHIILISSAQLFLFSCRASLFCPLTSHRFLFMSPLSTHIFIFYTHLSPLDGSISRMAVCLAHLWLSHRARHRARLPGRRRDRRERMNLNLLNILKYLSLMRSRG